MPTLALCMTLTGADCNRDAQEASECCATCSSASGTAEKNTADASLPAPYAPVLREYSAVMHSQDPIGTESNCYEYDTSMSEIKMGASHGSKYGYYLQDIDSDGSPELFIGTSSDYGYAENATEILGIYTIVDGQAKALCHGWSRSNYTLTNDSCIAHFGSSGASDSFAVLYTLSKHELKFKEGVRMMSTPDGPACYRLIQNNITAPSLSERDRISADDYQKRADVYAKRSRLLKLNPIE